MKAIIFDFDGVIHNTLELGYMIYKQMCTDASIEDYKNTFNGNIYKNDKISPEQALLFFEISGPQYAKLELGKNVIVELLKLKKKYPLFIISSNSEKVLRGCLENNASEDIFTEVLGFETHKSKVEKFQVLFGKYHLNKNDCIFVTDTLGDILEANRIGIDTIAVDFGFHEREKLAKGNPKRIISKFEDILPVVEEISKIYTLSNHA